MDDKIKIKYIHEDDTEITEKKMDVVEKIMDLCDSYKEKNKMDDKTKIKDVHFWVEFLNEDNKIAEKKVDVLEEFGGFDRKPEISYTITGQQPFKNMDYFTEEVKVYTFDKAIEKAKIFSKKYHDVYIAKQFEYVYQMM